MSAKKKPSLAQSAALMGIIILVSKVLGLVRDILTASAYGTETVVAKAYATASKLPITIFDFVLGGVVTAAFIPVYNSIAVKKGKKDALSFCQSYVNLILLVTAGITVIGVIFAPSLVRLIAPELSEEVLREAEPLTRLMFPMVIFVGLAFSFVGFLQSEGEYNIPALISLVSNLIMVAYLVFLKDRFGVTGLSAAMLIGWAAQAAVQIPAVLKRGFRPKITAPLSTPEIGRALWNALPILIATWTTPVCNLINTRFASGIAEGSAIPALDYANRLYILIVGLFSFVATNLIFPHLARAAASGDREESHRLTKTSLKVLVFIIAPIAAGVFVLAEPFVRLIYENGNFTASGTALTAEALRFYAVGMLFAACGEVLVKALFAAEKMKLPMIAALVSILANLAVVLSGKTLLGESFGVGVIASAGAAAAACSMILNLVFACRQNLVSFTPADVFDCLKSLLSALAMGIAVRFAALRTAGMGKLTGFAVPVLAGVLVYAVLTLVFRSEEAAGLIRAVCRPRGNAPEKGEKP